MELSLLSPGGAWGGSQMSSGKSGSPGARAWEGLCSRGAPRNRRGVRWVAPVPGAECSGVLPHAQSSFSRLRLEPQTGLLAVPWQSCARRAVRAARSLLSGSSAKYVKGKLHDLLEFSLLRNAS